jgi:hypothetical protein
MYRRIVLPHFPWPASGRPGLVQGGPSRGRPKCKPAGPCRKRRPARVLEAGRHPRPDRTGAASLAQHPPRSSQAATHKRGPNCRGRRKRWVVPCRDLAHGLPGIRTKVAVQYRGLPSAAVRASYAAAGPTNPGLASGLRRVRKGPCAISRPAYHRLEDRALVVRWPRRARS